MIKILKHPSSEFVKKYYSEICKSKSKENKTYSKLRDLIATSPCLISVQINGQRFSEYLNTNLEKIITGKPSTLQQIVDEISPTIKQNKVVLNRLGEIFSWKKFNGRTPIRNLLFEVLNEINVRVCPYCNRNYTTTLKIKSKNLIRPSFDHFFPKANYPYLALSLYNLIPSCSVCNSDLKKNTQVSLHRYTNPYCEGFEDNLVFHLNPKIEGALQNYNPSGFNLKLLLKCINKNLRKNVRSARLFKIKEIYSECHMNDAIDILKKCRVHNKKQLEDTRNLLINSGFVRNKINQELTKFMFSNEISLKNLGKQPLAKLNRDIINQYAPYILDFLSKITDLSNYNGGILEKKI